MKSKTIILSSKENTNSRGILTLYNEDDLLKCRLRLYNLEKLTKHTKIGVYHNEKVYSANLIERNGSYESSLVGDFDFNQDFYTALIETNNNNKVLLSGGTYAGYFFNDNSVFNNVENLNNEVENVETSTQEKEEIEAICKEDCSKCATCIYKEYFYKNVETFKPESSAILSEEPAIEEIETKPEKKEIKANFMESIIPQFKYIFENYNLDEELNSKIENSKFVKINEGSEQYSIGAIYENEKIKYLCYAVKSSYNQPAPQELGEHYQWLPLDKEDPLTDGYYLVFQDAKDLKILEI